MDSILIIDFGSQWTPLIARRIREMNVQYTISTMADATVQNRQGIILSGSHHSVDLATMDESTQALWSLNTPILGICYGMQLMAYHFGGTVCPGQQREFGQQRVSVTEHPLFKDTAQTQEFDVWMSHSDHVSWLPDYFTSIAHTQKCPYAAVAHRHLPYYGVQFHPEVTHTKCGAQILRNFVFSICQCTPSATYHTIIDQKIACIRQQVGQDGVLLALSGGLDSSVTAELLHRAVHDQLQCVLIDTGLLRKNEAQNIGTYFRSHLGEHFTIIDAQEQFLRALASVTDPEEKRKTIGSTFIDVLEQYARQKNATWLAQGTIYSDVIESAATPTQKATVIKSHHNVGGLPSSMAIKLLEPIRDLFKDEVRILGQALQLPDHLLYNHPFPGTGLATRIIGPVCRTFLAMLREADDIFTQELHACVDEDSRSWYQKTSQALAVFLPIQSVGVMGDGRTYEHVIAIRAVDTEDFMTATPTPLPHGLLEKVARRIINEVQGINRVVFDISSKPPSTIEWE